MSDDAPVWPAEQFSDLDRNGPVPLYYQVAERLERSIRNGTIPPGARIESELVIADKLRLSRPTIRRAIQELVDKGLLVRRRGIGTQVVQSHVTRPVELTSLFNDLQESHRNPSTHVLVCESIPAPAELASQLGQATGEPMAHLRRLRLMDGTPMAILENHLPSAYAGITEDDLTGGGLYDYLRGSGVVFKVANQRIGARRATAEEAGLLNIDEGSPLLTVQRTALDNSGETVEIGRHCYRPDLYDFETTLVAR
ncbi:MAG: GntR family transcriptional regulator [Mycobacteriaceae bacterium]|uniref:GntR family transcriptional regulator n=1 Tax=Corynebacterium sp. TaxID=1720 RepID=UPI003F9443CA